MNTVRTIPMLFGVFLVPINASCSRDPNIPIPEARRQSLDAEIAPDGGETYESIEASEDTIGSQTPGTGDGDVPVEEPQPEIPQPSEPVELSEPETPTAEAPPVPSPKPSPITKGPIESGRYVIEGVHSKKCLDVPSGGTANGLQMQLWACNLKNPNQWFDVEWVGHLAAYRLRTSTGKQLSVSPNKIESTSPLVLTDVTDGPHALFVIEESATGQYQIRVLDQAFVFDILYRETADGTPIQVFTPWVPAEAHQLWTFIEAK